MRPPSKFPYRIEFVEGLAPSARRGIVVLQSDEDKAVNASLEIESLRTGATGRDEPAAFRILRSRFDYWLSGNNGPKKYFHGWDAPPEHRNCFVFKWLEKNTDHRLYGFLFHPKSPHDPRFQVCVLVVHAMKNEFNTDKTILNRVSALRERKDIQRLLVEAFCERRA